MNTPICPYCNAPMTHFDQKSLGSFDLCENESCITHEVELLLLDVNEGTKDRKCLTEFAERSPEHADVLRASLETELTMRNMIDDAMSAGVSMEAICEGARRRRLEAGLDDERD